MAESPPRTVPPPPPSDRAALKLGVEGFTYADLFVPARLRDLHGDFDRWFAKSAPADYARFDAYRASRGEGMTNVAKSEALLAAAPHVGAYLARLFGVGAQADALRESILADDPIWRFKKEFAKKRVLKADAGKAWVGTRELAEKVARAAMEAAIGISPKATTDEELATARAVLAIFDVDDVARKAAKAGGAEWNDELRARASKVRAAIAAFAPEVCAASSPPTDAENAKVVAYALDACEAWLAARRADHHDVAHKWWSFHMPKTLDFAHLVEMKRPDPAHP